MKDEIYSFAMKDEIYSFAMKDEIFWWYDWWKFNMWFFYSMKLFNE